jgi:hypothetical protein
MDKLDSSRIFPEIEKNIQKEALDSSQNENHSLSEEITFNNV